MPAIEKTVIESLGIYVTPLISGQTPAATIVEKDGNDLVSVFKKA